MGATEQAIMSLFATVEQCRRDLAEHARSFRHAYDFGAETLFFTWLSTDRWNGPAGIDAFTEVRVLPGAAGQTNDLRFRLSVDVTETGFQVSSRFAAHLDTTMGAYEEGSHVLRENRSPLLDLDEALTEARSQTAAFADLAHYPARLGLHSA